MCIAGVAYGFRLNNQTVLIIHDALDIVSGMSALNTMHDRTIRVCSVDLLLLSRRKKGKSLFDTILQILTPGQLLVHRHIRG